MTSRIRLFFTKGKGVAASKDEAPSAAAVVKRRPTKYTMTTVPTEILEYILGFLPHQAVRRNARVCSFFNRACFTDTLWAGLMERDFGEVRSERAIESRPSDPVYQVYQAVVTGTHGDKRFEDRTPGQRAAIIAASIIMLPFLIVYLLPKIVEGIKRNVAQPVLETWRESAATDRSFVATARGSFVPFHFRPWYQRVAIIVFSSLLFPFLAGMYPTKVRRETRRWARRAWRSAFMVSVRKGVRAGCLAAQNAVRATCQAVDRYVLTPVQHAARWCAQRIQAAEDAVERAWNAACLGFKQRVVLPIVAARKRTVRAVKDAAAYAKQRGIDAGVWFRREVVAPAIQLVHRLVAWLDDCRKATILWVLRNVYRPLKVRAIRVATWCYATAVESGEWCRDRVVLPALRWLRDAALHVAGESQRVAIATAKATIAGLLLVDRHVIIPTARFIRVWGLFAIRKLHRFSVALALIARSWVAALWVSLRDWHQQSKSSFHHWWNQESEVIKAYKARLTEAWRNFLEQARLFIAEKRRRSALRRQRILKWLRETVRDPIVAAATKVKMAWQCRVVDPIVNVVQSCRRAIRRGILAIRAAVRLAVVAVATWCVAYVVAPVVAAFVITHDVLLFVARWLYFVAIPGVIRFFVVCAAVVWIFAIHPVLLRLATAMRWTIRSGFLAVKFIRERVAAPVALQTIRLLCWFRSVAVRGARGFHACVAWTWFHLLLPAGFAIKRAWTQMVLVNRAIAAKLREWAIRCARVTLDVLRVAAQRTKSMAIVGVSAGKAAVNAVRVAAAIAISTSKQLAMSVAQSAAVQALRRGIQQVIIAFKNLAVTVVRNSQAAWRELKSLMAAALASFRSTVIDAWKEVKTIGLAAKQYALDGVRIAQKQLNEGALATRQCLIWLWTSLKQVARGGV